MDLNLKAPPVLHGSEQAQLGQLRSYLYQMQQALLVAMDGINVEQAAQTAADAVRGSATLPDGGEATINEAYRQLKGLIIKTAKTVKHEYDQLVEQFESEYLAKSEFGEFQENLESTITTTAQGVVESYGYDSALTALQGEIDGVNQELVSIGGSYADVLADLGDLQTYNIDSEQYIKRGLLYFDENNVPRYGVAVGEKLTTITVNGEEVLQRTNLLSTFTSDRLSFWQNDVEVAYVSNNRLYIQAAQILTNIFLGNWVIDTTHGFTVKWAGV